jgi:beta-galactosidase
VPRISRVALALLGLLVLPLATASAAEPPASVPQPSNGAAGPSTADPPGAPLNDTRRTSFNDDWRFFLGDAPAAEQAEFDDSHWTPLRLPHDWAIDGPFDSALNPHTGALPISGTGWYRKTFKLPPGAVRRYYSIEFDGAMSNSRVWLNGHELGGRPYGYIGFAFDLTPFLHADASNVIAVRLTPEPDSSRWYPGAGIYRNVWLYSTGPVSVAHWGTYVTTPNVSRSSATVAVKTELLNRLSDESMLTVRSSVVDVNGQTVAHIDTRARLPGSGSQTLATRLTLQRPRLWDIDDPYLYSLITELISNGEVVDRYVTPFGVRTIAFDPNKGFALNGRALKLHGVCLHHDLGALGAAVNRRAIERQLQIMKAAGVNAVRTSHNPPAPELLEYADRMGLLVLDEAFDMWRIPKVPNGYSKYFDEWSERDLRDMVRRDRNHPSVIMWSIGNEIPEQKSPDGWQEARRLTKLFHEEDPTRPTTSAFNNWDDAIRNKLADEVDVPGFNYKPTFYQRIHKEHPKWIIYGSETASCVSSRGTYHLPLEKYEKHPSLQISSYDIIAPRWAYCPDAEFEAQEALPALLGEFVWTGFDYLGEPTPYFGEKVDVSHDWPSRSSYFGMVDLAGFPKDRYYLYQSVWSRKPMVHVLPHWNWEGRESQEIPVMVYSNAEEVELQLNGKSLGRKKTLAAKVTLPVGPNISPSREFGSKYRLLWPVPFQPGALTAIGYTAGKEVARDEVSTAGPPARIRLVADRNVLEADGNDLSFVTVRIEDQEGHLSPLADNMVSFQVWGAGKIAAVDNGNPATVEPFHARYRKAFNGLALLIVRSSPGEAGQIQVVATGAGLTPARLMIDTQNLKPKSTR